MSAIRRSIEVVAEAALSRWTSEMDFFLSWYEKYASVRPLASSAATTSVVKTTTYFQVVVGVVVPPALGVSRFALPPPCHR